ncbi:MAG: ABC transporter substrate-binding protein [Elusimicrobiales bacterium]|nr:ABC transporter substrate-binding protein [Elusimicrobiales bacterium]
MNKIAGFLIALILMTGCQTKQEESIGMAVEFMDHAACAYVSRDKGWFKEEGLNLSAYESYVTGMTLASAMVRGDIQVAYMCLIPAINVFANAQVPIKILAGTHKYGYGLAVNPDKIKTVFDLQKKGLNIGCVREGGAVDIVLHKTIDKYRLNKTEVLKNIRRMNPPKQILAVKSGKLDAAFLPEQWATMAEDYGFKMMLTAKDIWPQMQGSVLVIREDLLKKRPNIAEKLIAVTEKSTAWINKNQARAAEILARQMQSINEPLLPLKAAKLTKRNEINDKVLGRSMKRMNYTTEISPAMIQSTIDYMAKLGYIKKSFKAEEILYDGI